MGKWQHSPTVSSKAVLIMGTIDAKQSKYVFTADIPNTSYKLQLMRKKAKKKR